MKRLAFFSTFARSFYDLSVYREAAAADGGSVFWYFCRVMVIAIPLICFGCNAQLGRSMDEVSKTIGRADIPEVVIQRGQASTTVKQPWVRKMDDGSVFIIDTTGQTTALPANARSGILLTKDTLFVQQAAGARQLQMYPLKQFPDYTLNKTNLRSSLGTVKGLAFPITVIVLLVYYPIAGVVQAIFLSLVALVVFSSRQLKLGFAAAWNVALIAMTPVSMIVAVTWLVGIQVPVLLGWLLYYAAYIAYVVLGAMRCENPPPAPVNVPPPPMFSP